MGTASSWRGPDNPIWESTSPSLVRTVLAQRKELESQTTSEKARLRVDADKSRKKAQQLELHYKQLQGLHKYQGTELSAVKAALRRRDLDISDLQERLGELENSVGAAHFAERIEALQGENNDLQQELSGLRDRLQKTQRTLQEREDVHQEAQANSDKREREIQRERDDLDRAEGEARAQSARLSSARQRTEWQGRLFEQLLDALLNDRRDSLAALKDLLHRKLDSDEAASRPPSPEKRRDFTADSSPTKGGIPAAHFPRCGPGSPEPSSFCATAVERSP